MSTCSTKTRFGVKLNIPHLKNELILIEDWLANIHCESRNTQFVLTALNVDKKELKKNGKSIYDEIDRFYGINRNDGSIPWHQRSKYYITVTIPKDTKLIVDRIFIRAGASNYDSVTFRIPKTKKSKLHGRFWVKLDNANELIYEV